MPNISIPITEAVGQQLKVPVTLNYQNNGLKPSEEASWVGFGWSLEAGGIITRVVKDKVDEYVVDSSKYINTSWRYTTPTANANNSITNVFLEQGMYYGMEDTEPDVYAFNFAGYSGKFVIYKTKIYQYPYQQLTITGDPASGFVIVTPDGTQYKFTLPEVTTSLNHHTSGSGWGGVAFYLPETYTSSWYLQTIYSADYKDNITFTYSTPDMISQNGPATQTLQVLQWAGPVYTVGQLTFPSVTTVAMPRLTKITTSKMYINFKSATTGRQDVPGSYALDTIQVYNYQGQLLKQFKFNTDYFSSSAFSNTLYNTRLRLTGLDEGISAQNTKKTRFYYNEASSYPSKKLGAVDHWGFSIGGDILEGTGVILPKYFYGTNTILYPLGIDRSPNFTYSPVTVLNKIIYPTGGSTVFQYEPNLYNDGTGIHYVMQPKQQTVEADSLTASTVTSSFTLYNAQTVQVIISRIPIWPVGGTNNGPNNATKDFTPQLTLTSGSFSQSFVIDSNKYNTGKIFSVSLQPGTYTMTTQLSSLEKDAWAEVNWLYQTNQVIEGTPGPGIRIKQITDYTNPEATKIASTKQYVYKDSTGQSTGVLLNIPSYGGKTYYFNNWAARPIIHNTYVNYTSNNCSGMNTSQDMYYSQVYERQVRPGDTLMSKSLFSIIAPYVQNGTTVFLTNRTDYKQTGGTYSQVKSQRYHYSMVTDTAFFAVKPFLQEYQVPDSAIWGAVKPGEIRIYGYDLYTVEPSWLRLDSTSTINFYNTSDAVTTSTKYLYDAHPRNKIMETTTDSKGRLTIEKYKYPESYEPGFASSLTDHAIYSPVLEKQTWLKRSATDSVLTNGIITQWDPALLRPTALYGFESVTPVSSLNAEAMDASGLYVNYMSDSRYKLRLSNGYDSGTGNLLWQDMTGNTGVKQINYLWGYHNNYPIAQVKNANPAAIAYTSFEDDDNSFTYTASGVTNADARTGVKCYSGAISKTGLPSGNYIFSLWGKGSGTITVGGVAKTMTSTWAFYQWQLTGITGISVNSNSNLIDEVRLFPVNALMTSYTYNPEVGVTSIADTRDMPQTYEYDDMQRPQNIKDKNGNIVKNFTYNYATQTAYWQDTGTLQCVQSGGVNTGEQQMQQKDLNPLSPTYNQYQWRSLGISSNCPVPVTVYVQMTVASAYTGSPNGLTQTYNTYAFKTFSDAACTLPFNVTADLVVNYQINSTIVFNDTTKPNSNTSSPATITITAGTHQATTAGIDVSGCSGSDIKGSCTTSSVVMQTGTGYVPVYPQN